MDKLGETLAALAEKLGTTVEALWPALVRYEQVMGWTVAAALLVGLVAGLTSLQYLRRYDWADEDGDITPHGMVAAVSFGALVLALVVCFLGAPTIATMILTPEACAVHRILRGAP